MMKVSIIGVGRLGGSLAIALSRAGIAVSELFVRTERDLSHVVRSIEPEPAVKIFSDSESIDADVVIIAVPDPAIEEVAGELVGKLPGVTVVLHTSGSLSSEVLGTLAAAGHATGSLHPLVSFSEPALGAERLRGSYFCLEGSAVAVDFAGRIVIALGGNSFTVETSKKSLYHAAAVTACGSLVALLDVAFEMLSECGVSREHAQKVLLPLVKGTVMNLESQSTAEALTGPFSRADIPNFERNLSAIEEGSSQMARRLYLELGERSLELAEKQGADPGRIAELREKIRLAK